MQSSQRSLRVMHCLEEFLDLDATSFTSVADFIALIQAIREGLSRIDSGFAVSDFQVNILFLSKLEAHPDWNDWAGEMLRDNRICVSDHSAQSIPFLELAEMAIQHDRQMRARPAAPKRKQSDGIISVRWQDDGNRNSNNSNSNSNKILQSFTQEEINSFVVRQMRTARQQQQQQPLSTNAPQSKGHTKRPSQEEINEFVVRQMREEQERNARVRSKSEPKPKIPTAMDHAASAAVATDNADNVRCNMCGENTHPGRQCRFYSKTTAVVPRANFAAKKVEFRTETPGGFPMYHTSFALT